MDSITLKRVQFAISENFPGWGSSASFDAPGKDSRGAIRLRLYPALGAVGIEVPYPEAIQEGQPPRSEALIPIHRVVRMWPEDKAQHAPATPQVQAKRP